MQNASQYCEKESFVISMLMAHVYIHTLTYQVAWFPNQCLGIADYYFYERENFFRVQHHNNNEIMHAGKGARSLFSMPPIINWKRGAT